MNYPQHLLPKSNYKKIEYCDNLKQCSLVRHTDNQDIFMVGTKVIDVDKIKFPSEHFKNDLSTNILGIFQLDDVLIHITNKDFTENWQLGQAVCCPIFEQDFVINRDRGYFTLIIENILSLNNTAPLIERGLRFKVIHTPTKSNFWHFSIQVSQNNVLVGDLDIKEKEKIKLWRIARTLISELAHYIEGEFYNLPENRYISK